LEKLQREDVVNGFTSDSASEDQCEITDERHSYSFIHETAESLAPKPAGLVATSIGGKSVPAISHAARPPRQLQSLEDVSSMRFVASQRGW
jgi:hypothetical protein